MNKPFNSNPQPLDNELTDTMTDYDLFHRIGFVMTRGCLPITQNAKNWDEKMETKYQACIASFLSGTAQKCFGKIDVLDAQDTSDETINKLKTCLENDIVKNAMKKASSIVIDALHTRKLFKKYIDHIMNDATRDEFGDDENPNYPKWEQSKFCKPEIDKYEQCMQQKIKQYQIPYEEFEEAVHNGKTLDCFPEFRSFHGCFSTSFCGKKLYECMKNTNQNDSDFMTCFQPDIVHCVNRAWGNIAKQMNDLMRYSKKTTEYIDKVKKF